MNGRQLRALWVGIVATVVMLVFPPFKSDYSSRFRGYKFIGKDVGGSSKVDTTRLTLGLLAVAAITGGAIVTVKSDRR